MTTSLFEKNALYRHSVVNTKNFLDYLKPKIPIILGGSECITVSEPILYLTGLYSTEMRSCAYLPVVLYAGMYINKKDENLRNRENWPHSLELVQINYDASNCGVGMFHKVNNNGIRGLGTMILNLVENIMISSRRKYVLCTINQSEAARGSTKWLLKHNYKQLDTFVGGNSGSTCFVFAKDLNNSPCADISKCK